jgi:hypothetical protein
VKALAPRRSVVSDDLADLAAIYEPEVNVCVVRRELQIEPISVSAPTSRFCLRRGEPAPFPDRAIRDDLAQLVELLTDLTGVTEVGVRLRAQVNPMCPAFHVDHVPLRLVCTYLGPGTEYLDEAEGGPLVDCGATWRRGVVCQAVRGDVVLLKGEGWPGNERRGAAHRSPAHTAMRLVASLDPL